MLAKAAPTHSSRGAAVQLGFDRQNDAKELHYISLGGGRGECNKWTTQQEILLYLCYASKAKLTSIL